MHRWLPLLLILALVAAFRVVAHATPATLPNFQPLTALFFCAALLIPGRLSLMAPLAIWAFTYLALDGIAADPVFPITLLALTAIFFVGKKFAHTGTPAILLGSLAAAVAFHLITNGAIWLTSPYYEKSLTGLWQSVWAGPPSSSIPSWVFLRNLAAANILFTGIILAARFRLPALTLASPAARPDKA